jgi:hypothetical protein
LPDLLSTGGPGYRRLRVPARSGQVGFPGVAGIDPELREPAPGEALLEEGRGGLGTLEEARLRFGRSLGCNLIREPIVLEAAEEAIRIVITSVVVIALNRLNVAPVTERLYFYPGIGRGDAAHRRDQAQCQGNGAEHKQAYQKEMGRGDERGISFHDKRGQQQDAENAHQEQCQEEEQRHTIGDPTAYTVAGIDALNLPLRARRLLRIWGLLLVDGS